MLTDPIDATFMRLALDLAAKGQGHVEPNPMVGCVLVQSGEVIGQGYHQQFGGPHAEIHALRSLSDPADARGATAYVTLEPCCHHGKTPPCTESLIRAGITRVVIAMQDSFSKVDGEGIRQLQASGIEVNAGILQEEAEQLAAPFAKQVRTGQPWVIAKWAMTMDGRIATTLGESQWISGQASRAEVHRLRSRVDAIAVGMGTVTADNPMLDARFPEGTSPKRVATRVVFCQHRLPDPLSKVITTAGEIPTLLVTTPAVPSEPLTRLMDAGALSLVIDTEDRSAMVHQALLHLGKEGGTNLLVEGGGELLSSFFSAGEIDEAHVYLGAKAFGGTSAPGPIGGAGIDRATS